MALQFPIRNVYTAQDTQAYSWISLFQVKFDTPQLRMDTLDYVNKDAYLTGTAQPLRGTSFVLPAEGLPALDSEERRLHKKENGTYVLETEKDNPDAQTVVPAYTELPSMMQYLMSVTVPPGGFPEGTPIFPYLMYSFYQLLATRPEFKNSTVVDV